jgi:outer membrane protein OmpA-like peptidoglycan-associated protein
MRSLLTTCAILLLFLEIGHAQQEIIELRNSSFEGIPRKGEYMFMLDGWTDCGDIYFSGETPPDVHPAGAAWQNMAPTFDGRTYVGLVVRDNDSWESISQRLSTSIEANKCYKFSIAMMRSDKYVSLTRLNTDREENYQEPAVLRIWGGSGYCNQRELLAESDAVTNRAWKTYDFEFNPQFNHRYFTLEVFYKTPVLFPYNGHILIDAASSIERIACPDEEPLVVVEEEVQPEEQSVLPPHKRKKQVEVVPESEVPEEVVEEPVVPKIMEELDRKTVKKGQIIKIKNLYFPTDKSVLDTRSHIVLDEIFYFLKQNADINIEIGGHTNGLCQDDFCDELSERRAKVVAEYLVRKGISPSRLEYKGYGKRNTIASDRTAYGRQKNQRVEIKITDISDT